MSHNHAVKSNIQQQEQHSSTVNDLLSPTDERLIADFRSLNGSGKRRARCLNDYQAVNSSELSLRANEVIVVSHSSDLDPEWMLAERQAGIAVEKGKVPVAYLEILN